MFATIRSRFVVVASGAWLLGALWLSQDKKLDDYFALVAIGWAAIVLTIYGTCWVLDGSAIRIRMPKVAAYVLIAVMVFLIMGLPKVIF